MQVPSRSAIFPSGAVILLLTFIAGCSSPQEKRAAFREKMGPPQPTLIVTQALLKDRIEVTARLGGSLPPRSSGGGDEQAEGGRHSGGGPAGGGRWGGGEGRDSPHSGGGMGMRDGEGRPQRGGAGGGTFPRQALSVTLKNTSTESITVRVLEVASILGNFVPFPEKATLTAGESVTLEPMRGSLANLDELDLTVALSAGADRDRQTLALRRE